VKVSALASAALAATLALVVVLALGEVGLRIATRYAISYDVEMTRYSNELKLPSANPRIGHEHRPNADVVLMGVRVETNAQGLRDRDYPIERTAERRYAFLGDSLTFGWGVEKPDLFETLLEDALGAQILNFGHGNYNTDQQVALFREKGLAFAPDEVVVFYFINDAEPTPQRSRWSFLGHSRVATFVWSRIKTVRSRLGETQGFAAYYAGLYEDGQPGFEQMKRAFTELRDLCRERGIGLRVVLLPELHDPANEPFRAQYALVLAHLASLGVPALDLSPGFRDEQDPLALWVALDDAHPNARAHRKIAELARPFLEGAR